MAIGTPVDRGSAGGITTATTSSFTPAAGDLLLALVFGRRNTAAPAQPTISDSLGGTWTEIADATYDAGSNPRLRARLFYQQVSTAASMTVTGSISDGTTTAVMVVSLSGAGTDFSNSGYSTDASGDPSITLASPSASSVLVGFTAQNATNLLNPSAELTELVDSSYNSTMRGGVAYLEAPATSTVSWTSTNTFSIGFAVEVKEASAGGYTLAADGGACAMAPAAVTLAVARRIAAASFSFAASGAGAALGFVRRLSSVPGTVDIAGGSALLSCDRVCVAGAVACALAGSVAALTADRLLLADGGSLVVSGENAAFGMSGSIDSASGGTFTISGASATLKSGRHLLPEAGSYMVDGSNAGVEYGRLLTAGWLALAVDGAETGLAHGRLMSAEPNPFSVVGPAAILDRDRRISVADGAFSFTGAAAILRHDASDIDVARAMSADLLPANRTLHEEALAVATDPGGPVLAAIEPVRGFRYQRPLDATVAPWLVLEYGLGPIADFFGTVEDLIDQGRVWQRLRGTPQAVTTSLSWIQYLDISIEDQVSNRRRWHLYQIEMGELPGDDEATRLARAEYLAGLSDPARSEFYRGYHGYDVREMALGSSRWGDAIWGDVSGVRISDGSVKWSHGRAQAVTISSDVADWAPFGWDERVETEAGWPNMPWDVPGLTWLGVEDYDAARAWLVLRKQAHVVFLDGNGLPIGYARVIREPVLNAAAAGTVSVTYTVQTGFGDGAGSAVAGIGIAYDLDTVAGIKPAKAWLEPSDVVEGSGFVMASGAFALEFRLTVRETVSVTLNLQAV